MTRVPGIKNMLFGGDGIFLAALTGPGRVWLQSLPLSNLAHALQPYLSRSVERVEDAGAGSVISSVFRRLANGQRLSHNQYPLDNSHFDLAKHVVQSCFSSLGYYIFRVP